MSFRITNSIMVNNYVRNMQNNQQRMNRLQNQIETTNRLIKPSEDPVGAMKVLEINAKISDIEVYLTNLDNAEAWLVESETAVSKINEYVKRMYELAVNLSNETKTPEDRMAAANEIRGLRDELVSTANMTMTDKYLFGSHNVAQAPFHPADPSDPNSEMLFNGISLIGAVDMTDVDAELQNKIQYKVGFKIDMNISISGIELMGIGDDANIHHVMNDFYKACMDPDSTWETISPFMGKFQSIQTNILGVQAEIGGRMNRITAMQDTYSIDMINYKDLKSKVEEIDMAETITYFSMAEAVYRAALSVGSRVIQPTLMDFLR